MFPRNLLRTALALCLLAVSPAGWTIFDPVNDDTDIFLANPAITSERPNVLIFVDNTANWNQAFDTEKSSLVSVVGGLDDNFNVGMGMFVETGNPNDNIDGAYIRFGIRQMTTTNKTAFTGMVTALDKLGDKGNNATYSLAMDEMFRYFSGTASMSGFGKVKRDFTGNTTYNSAAASLAGNPFVSSSATTYVSPITNGCQKNFIIFISNGPAGDNASSLSTAQTDLSALVGKNPPDTITISPNGEQGLWSDEYAKFMANSDCNTAFDGVQNVYTYTIDVLPTTTGQGPAHTAQLQSMASNGKGKYFAITDTSSTAQLTNALNTIFNEVQAVNSVFASTTLPVSVNVRGTNLNQVYIGVFRPDATKSPKWLGNLKLYKLGVNTSNGTLFLADQNGLAAENASTGFITGSATSYWTASSTYWAFRDSSLNGVGGTSDSPDGDLVEKGGAAQELRIKFPTSQTSRNLYTCVNATHSGLCAAGASLSATPFNNTNVTAADLGAFTTYTASTLTSSATTATLVLPSVPVPIWATGDQIVVAGATPTNYNGTFNLTSANNLTFTYTYSLASAPDATTAQATGTNHNLRTGDLVTVSGTSTNFDITDAAVTRIDANNFKYSTSVALTGSLGATTVVGKKQLKSITGISGTTTATVVVSGLTQYANGDVLTISGNAAASQAFFDATSATISNVANDTVNNNTSFTYTTSASITGGGSTVQLSAATGNTHNISSSQSNVYIVGSNVSAYNTGPLTSVSTIDSSNLTFASTATSVGTGGTIGVGITNFSHPTTGSGNSTNCGAQDVLTVTTSGNHNIIGPFPYNVTIAGGASGFAVYNGIWTLNSSADVPSTTTFKITQSSTTNKTSANGTVCGFDGGTNGSPGTLGTVVAGKPIGSINPIVGATGSPLYAAKSISLSGVTALTNAVGAITAGRTADGDNTARDLIINWARGADNVTTNNEDSATDTTPAGTDIRPSVHGDVLHSRPAVVNYNRYGDDNDIYAFYGSNDGIFHALKGGITNHTTGADTTINPGTERWGFVAREFFSHLKRLRDQSPTITSVNQKDYFADGSIGVYQKDAKGNGDSSSPLNCDPADTATCSAATVTGIIGDNIDPVHGDKVLLFLTMRRGGNFIYALDVTNPATPKLLWQHSASDTHWSQLGQTWSEPKIAKVSASLGNTNNPDNVVLIFGGGYDDAAEDIPPCLISSTSRSAVVQKAIGAGSVTYKSDGTCTISNATGSTTSFSRTVGNAIFVVDAISGNIVWKASGNTTTSSSSPLRLNVPQMDCAIPSDTQVLDKNRDGFADRIYVGDTCGQMWRADISKADMTKWSVTRMARISSVTSSGTTDVADARKFLFPPDLVFGTDGSGNYTAVLLGSGDREHPFDTVVTNRFYMFKDRDSADPSNPQVGAPNNTTVDIAGTYSTPASGSSLVDTDLFDATTTALIDGTDPLGLNGWEITLAAGEKVVSSSATVAGTTFFNTNQPSSTAGGGACGSNLGIAREYEVGFADAAATIDLNASGGLTIADRSTIHAGGGYLPSPVPVVVEIGGKKYQAVISGTSVQTPPGLTLEKRVRAYWYKEVE